MQQRIEWVMRVWLKRGLWAYLLWPFSVLFNMLVVLRRQFYCMGIFSVVKLPVPVIVVGNIFVGGTGKTPFVLWLVQQLRLMGHVPGVVSRGYGGQGVGIIFVNETVLPDQVGDEPCLIFQQTGCPVVVGQDRVAAASALLARYPQINCIISDDGLQHYRLGRKVEIMVLDERGMGNGFLFPAGPLRESVNRHVDFKIMNTPESHILPVAPPLWQMKLKTHAAYTLFNLEKTKEIASFGGKIISFAGIGNPDRFFSSLRFAGILGEEIALPDHAQFEEEWVEALCQRADAVLMTEKDAVKCVQLKGLRQYTNLWVVPVSVEVDSDLAQKIWEKCNG